MLTNLKQQTPEWHAFRKQHIMASMAPTIMGESKWTTPYQLFCEITGLEAPKKSNRFMQDGLEIEEQARKWFESKTGLHVEPVVVQHDKIHFMGASLDGYNYKTQTIVEIKYAGQNDHNRAVSGLIPDHYKAQLTHQMLCCGVDSCWYISYRGENSVLVKVHLDEIYAAELLVAVSDFWDRIKNFDPPELTDRDYDQQDSEEWQTLAQRALVLQDRQRQDEQEMDEIKERLEMISEGRPSIGGGIKWSETTRKGSIDYKKIDVLKNIDLELYRKSPTKYFRISKQ